MMTLLLEKTDMDVIIRIPKEYWNKTDMVDSSEVKIDLTNDGIEIMDISVKTWTLDELLVGVTPENCHPDLFSISEKQEETI